MNIMQREPGARADDRAPGRGAAAAVRAASWPACSSTPVARPSRLAQQARLALARTL